ncbi:unnamed protein product [Caenorhabditis angaria]|uniref:NADP-dependent oxidoreductase domain-containing protein n=1 Tax=Caenorhabditis angaria TaxID=860376 RepID=A0A9P1IYE9_9PELO|nr:unnamed protein product [Caenorhabditis angaria]
MVVGGTRKLNSGYEIPLIGMGCSRNIEQLDSSVEAALKSGYRLFDTARIYNNEKELGESLKTHLEALNIKREDIFITTKVPTINDSPAASVDKHIADSLNRLQVDYIDLVLIHYPRDRDTGIDSEKEVNVRGRKEVYQKLEEYVDRGIIRSIGVSNYEPYHLHELLQYARVKPSVNQIEYQPYCTKPQVVEICNQNNIFVQAYSSLCWGNQEVLNEPIIAELAKNHNVSPQTILYAFAVNSGVGIIPKSATPSRISDNLNLVASIKLTESELKQILDLDRNQQFCPRCYPWRVL